MLQPEHTYEIDYFFRKVLLLSNEDFIAELTDHFSTGIEERMTRDLTFPEALQEVYGAFGGQKAIRQMEWEYNQVTFRKYDRFWKDAVLLQCKGQNLWITAGIFAALFLFASYLTAIPSADSKAGHFISGLPFGAFFGAMITSLNALLPYVRDRIFKGPHNPQSEAWYMFKRSGLFVGLFLIIGVTGNVLAPIPPILSAVYFTTFYVYLRTQGQMYRFLYDVPEVY